MHAEPVEIGGGTFRRRLLEPLVIKIMQEADGLATLRDARRLVERGVDDIAAKPGNLVAVGIVGEGLKSLPEA